MKTVLFLFFLLLVSNTSAQNLSVFVAAHPDDWQLFMNPNAYEAVADSNQSVIFLHITAGDAGHAMGYSDYTIAREEGSKRAIRFLVNAAHPDTSVRESGVEEIENINGFPIQTYSYQHTKAYFLRLPDGNFDGNGYPTTNFESVRKIVSGEKQTINAIDQTATYSRDSLIETIKTILMGNHSLDIHIAETDSALNPGDHSDHQFSAHLIKEVMKNPEFTMYQQFRYINYYTNNLPMNIFSNEYQVSVGTWGATISGITDYGHYSTWDELHNSWLDRQYFAVDSLAKGTPESVERR